MNNFTEILTEQAKKQPDAIAIISENEQITYKELDDLVWQCATYLYQQGTREGDVVIHIIDDELLITISMFASARIGSTFLSVSKIIADKLLNEIINKTNASHFVLDSKINKSFSLKTISLKKEVFEKIKINKNIYRKDPENPWRITVGSGSTGKQKLVPTYHKQFINRLKLTADWFPIEKGDIFSSFTSLIYGASQGLFAETIYTGATYVLLQENNRTIDFINKYHVNILHSTALHIENLLHKIDSRKAQQLNDLKMLLMGASKISSSLRKRVRNNLTSNLYVRYGINEVHTISITKISDVFTVDNSVGKPINGVTVEIVDENDKLKPINEIGFIRIKSSGMSNGYFNDIEATERAFKNGWFYPGDMGKLSNYGQLIHLGRSDGMIIMNGVNVYTTQIENDMLKHSSIIEAYAFPMKHLTYQEIPVCAVVLKENSTETQKTLLRYARENLGLYGPRYIAILKKTPRNEQGKIIKKDLVELVTKQMKERLNND